MNKTLNTLIAALLLSGASHALAASSVDLTVKGLITPSACEPSLGNGGLYDLGKISARDLNVDQITNMGEHILQLTVTCDAATLMAIEPKDNREGSSFDNVPGRFGLGLINGNEKLGFLEMWLTAPLADGVVVRAIGSQDGGSTWIRQPTFTQTSILSVANTDSLIPIPVQLLSADLNLTASIAPTQGLSLTNEALIDGSVTLTVKYL